jgi:phage terminase large subunit-like protein
MPGLLSLAGRVARAEVRLSPAAPRIADRSRWDWYAHSYPCGRAADECTIHPRARAGQRPPGGDWRTWLLLGGRAAGKTRSAAELVRHWAESGQARRIGLIAPTAADYRDTMIQGPSGLLSIAPPWNRPKFEPSKRRLTWPNGALAICLSTDQPERARGLQFDRL